MLAIYLHRDARYRGNSGRLWQRLVAHRLVVARGITCIMALTTTVNPSSMGALVRGRFRHIGTLDGTAFKCVEQMQHLYAVSDNRRWQRVLGLTFWTFRCGLRDVLDAPSSGASGSTLPVSRRTISSSNDFAIRDCLASDAPLICELLAEVKADLSSPVPNLVLETADHLAARLQTDVAADFPAVVAFAGGCLVAFGRLTNWLWREPSKLLCARYRRIGLGLA